MFFMVVVILGHNLGNSQVSVYRTIGPTLVLPCSYGVQPKLIFNDQQIYNFNLFCWISQVRADLFSFLFFSYAGRPLEEK